MTADQRFERHLPAVLEGLYLGPTPDYRDEVLAAAVRTRQRASWTFPGRWLPMSDIAVYRVPVRAFPLRAVGFAVLLAALLVATLVVVGSRSKAPPPFGVARNGVIAWALDGDVYVGDPLAGNPKRVVATDDIDRNPVFSRDGTHLAFLRQVPSKTGQFDLVVTASDGTGSQVLTATPITIPEAVQWSPDGTSLLVNDGDRRLTRYFVDKSPARLVLEGVHIGPEAFQPPAGNQILYEREDDPGALYVVNADGSAARQLVGPATSPCTCPVAGPARWSPDGQSLVFPVNPDGVQSRLYRMDVDGTGFRQLADEDGVWVENDPAWSPDGTRVAFNRWQRDDSGDWRVRPIAVSSLDGDIRAIGVAPASEGALIEWSPDGKTILSLPGTLLEAFTWSPGASGTVARPTLIEVDEGGSRQIDWSVGSISSWQRLAP
jgi:dipeptidyl aminopeptidase/acylaminoacyl peptidase